MSISKIVQEHGFKVSARIPLEPHSLNKNWISDCFIDIVACTLASSHSESIALQKQLSKIGIQAVELFKLEDEPFLEAAKFGQRYHTQKLTSERSVRTNTFVVIASKYEGFYSMLAAVEAKIKEDAELYSYFESLHSKFSDIDMTPFEASEE